MVVSPLCRKKGDNNMLIDEKVEVLKEGITQHNCSNHNWVIDFNHESPKNVYEYKRICKECGRVERVTEHHEMCSFDEVFQRFHKEVL